MVLTDQADCVVKYRYGEIPVSKIAILLNLGKLASGEYDASFHGSPNGDTIGVSDSTKLDSSVGAIDASAARRGRSSWAMEKSFALAISGSLPDAYK